MPDVFVRPATAADIGRMRAIEIAAGQLFLSVDMPEIAADDPPDVGLLNDHIDAGTAWVAEMESGGRSAVVGYVIASVVDGAAHVDQVSVDPSAERRGIGRRLLAVVAEWAMGRGISWLTLTTFRDVPWNGPYYARLGFEVMPPSSIGRELRALVDEETAAGLDPTLRVCMRAPAADLTTPA
jgi:GNAT superfamily N-acetyltransferase